MAKTPAWTRKEGKSEKGGLNAKGRASYNKANPGKPGLKAPQPEGGSRKKSFCARGVALQLMFRYPSDEGLGAVLSPLAREELEHFELVLQLLQRRGIALRPLPAPGYGAQLTAAVRKGEPQRMLDAFLVAGLIEARSHERMALLAVHSQEAELRDLYSELLASEARHFGLYWLLCEERYGREVTVARLQELAALETQALTGFLSNPEDVRMHSCGVELGI